MANRPPRDQSTTEIVDRLKRKKSRQRGLKIGAVVAAALVLLTGIAWAAAATLQSTASPATNVVAATTTISVQAAAPRTTLPPGTTHTLPPRPSTSLEPVVTPETVTTSPPTTVAPAAGFLVVIDPGHQRTGDSSTEPIGPGSSEVKRKAGSGTSGVVTRTSESELVLLVSLRLRDVLQARGVRVIMTRTTQDANLSNIDRSMIANEANADLYIRVHADGSTNSAANGIHVLYPAVIAGWTDDIAAPSKRAAELVQAELIRATGAKDRGIDPRTDMVGFNWSDVPVIIPEIGFMTNPDEDLRLAEPAYQAKIAFGMAEGAIRFLEEQAR